MIPIYMKIEGLRKHQITKNLLNLGKFIWIFESFIFNTFIKDVDKEYFSTFSYSNILTFHQRASRREGNKSLSTFVVKV